MQTTQAQQELRSFVERIEHVDEEIKDRNSDKKEIFGEARARGYDVNALKAVIRRRRDREKTTELDAMVDLYEKALGMVPATHVQAQEAA